MFQIYKDIRIYETKDYNVNEDETITLSPAWKLIIQVKADDRKRKLKETEGQRKEYFFINS